MRCYQFPHLRLRRNNRKDKRGTLSYEKSAAPWIFTRTNGTLTRKRIKKTRFWNLWPAWLILVNSAVNASEPVDFEQTKLESGVTVADIEPLQDGRLLMALDHDGELKGSFSQDQGKTWTASFQPRSVPVHEKCDLVCRHLAVYFLLCFLYSRS